MVPTFEHRKLYRADIILKVDYKTVKAPLVKGTAFTKNISSTGLNVIMPHGLSEGTKIDFKIYIKGDSKAVSGEGEILWSEKCSFKPDSNREYYSAGVLIDDMSSEDAILESDFVREILVRKSMEETIEIIKKLESLS